MPQNSAIVCVGGGIVVVLSGAMCGGGDTRVMPPEAVGGRVRVGRELERAEGREDGGRYTDHRVYRQGWCIFAFW